MEKLMESLKVYLKEAANNPSILVKLIKVVIIIIITRILVSLVHKFIETTIQHKNSKNFTQSQRRVRTLGDMGKKVSKFVLYFFATMIILNEFNIDTNAILGAAGIGGLAVGFGAQSLVKDILSGFFILQEDSFVIGDHVKIGDFEGYVEDVGLRVTKVKGFGGDLHIIPNGEITIISNLSRDAVRALVVVSIAYEENVDKALRVLEELCIDLANKEPHIVEGPDVLGIDSLGDTGVNIRILTMTDPSHQWRIERDIRKKVKDRFDEEGIEIPYPRMVMLEGGKN